MQIDDTHMERNDSLVVQIKTQISLPITRTISSHRYFILFRK